MPAAFPDCHYSESFMRSGWSQAAYQAGSNRESLENDRGAPMRRDRDVIAAVSVGVVVFGCGSGISEATAAKKMWTGLKR